MTVEEMRALKFENTACLDFTKGGYARSYRAKDHPNIGVTIAADTRRSPARRTIFVEGHEFPIEEIQAAVDCFNALQGEP